MNRRDFVERAACRSAGLGALSAMGALPWMALAAEPASGSVSEHMTERVTDADRFDAAVARRPWLLPFKGVSDATQDLQCDALHVTGTWPKALRGRFYRNGPALFERGGQRYRHWFDGDGMVQQFTFGERGVSHRGRLVRTPKLLAEQQAGKFLYSAFGTDVHSDAPVQGPDSFNTANTNALEHAGRVLAMWEGGSAFALDPKDLSTTGPVTWRSGLEQLPFSAHPKVDAQGHLWNIGTAGRKLIVWHIDPRGALASVQVGESPYPGGLVHDMAVTANHLVVPLPPVKLHFGKAIAADGSGADQAFEFQREQPLRILVLRKDDVTRRQVFELPAQMVFHVGNAFERADGNIAFSFVGAPDHAFLTRGATSLMRGEPQAVPPSSTQLAELNLRTGRASVQGLGDAVEFPRIDPRRIGLPARHLVSAAGWVAHPERLCTAFHGVQVRDTETGKVTRFDYGANAVVEEHLLVPKPGSSAELDAWLIGTTFDVRRQVTVVNVLEARHVADGPVAQAALPYRLPLAFHGNFAAG